MANSARLPRQRADDPPVPWMHGAAGIAGGALSMTMFYPLDFIRTRMQAQDGSQQRNLRGAREIARTHGVSGLYRGVATAVTAHSIGWGTYLTTFRCVQGKVRAHRGKDSALGDFGSACVAATCTSTLVTPLNLLKTRKQLDDSCQCRGGFMQGLGRIVRNEGFTSLFRGVGPQILLSSHTTIQVALYEGLKRHWWPHQQDSPPMIGVAAASGFSKAIATVITNPLEVCRTRLQDKRNLHGTNYSSMTEGFRTIWRMEGIAGMYRGSTVNILRVVPTTVVAFMAYEKCLMGIRTVSCVLKDSKAPIASL